MNRIGFASLLCLSVFALNLSAFDGASAATEGTGNAGAATASGTTKTVSVKDIDELRKRIAEQEEQIKHLQQSLAAQRDLLETTVRAVSATGTVETGDARLVNAGGITPIVSSASRSGQASNSDEAPLSLKIGNTSITPVGFMDLTYVIRSTNVGSGIGTNFGSIPYKNTAPGQLSDNYLSVQNSRIGARFDALYHGAKVLGYWESDFLGNQPTNILVSSNAATFRLRLFYVDVQKNGWEILGGQSWSMMTPNRRGISAIPGDIFFTQNVDTNYQIGLTWARQSGFRAVYHAGDKFHFGLAFENPQQYIGGSSGGGTAVLPSNLPATLASQVNSGAASYATPALHPDIIGKVAVDFSPFLHSEVAGIVSSTKTYNTASGNTNTTTGGGVSFNNNIGIGKRLRIIESATYGRGVGRYFFGQGPDVVINSDGRATNVKAAGGIAGVEAQVTKSTLFYGYYGTAYFGRSNVWDPTAKKFVGYGYAGSSNGQNRTIEEATFGLQQTFWKDAKYGALAFFLQYSYLFRNPWFVAAGAPNQANTNMVFLNLRYTLPGAPPKLQAAK